MAWRTPPVHYGPWEQMASNIAEGLVDKGIEVTLFATADSITKAHLAAVVPVGYEEDKKVDAKVVECMHISYLMERSGSFDIIHNHFDFLPLTYSRLISTPMITTIHGFSSPKIIPVYKRYNDINHYVSISESDRSPELRYLATVYNGINTDTFTLKEDPGNDYLLFFGRIHPDKGAWEAIQIAHKSGRQLMMAGIIQDKAYFDEKIAPHLDDGRVRFVGAAGAEQRDALLGGAYALLHPISFEEPFGLSVVEAMLCGTPVVAFARGAMAELIRDGETGFLVNSVDEAVTRLPMVAGLNRAGCHRWAKSKFSQQKMVDDYVDLYKRILGDG
ncbi:MAG TPA: glycosyltransferase family 4 protein [Chitinophagaceae bacterium]|nr:glycosyltransferase family 4 protein [Chitinophagaceae bacterium]